MLGGMGEYLWCIISTRSESSSKDTSNGGRRDSKRERMGEKVYVKGRGCGSCG